MKKITLIVPDHISVSSSLRFEDSSIITKEVTEEVVRLALTENDYHMNHYFPNKDEVKIVSIESL